MLGYVFIDTVLSIKWCLTMVSCWIELFFRVYKTDDVLKIKVFSVEKPHNVEDSWSTSYVNSRHMGQWQDCQYRCSDNSFTWVGNIFLCVLQFPKLCSYYRNFNITTFTTCPKLHSANLVIQNGSTFQTSSAVTL